MSDHLPRRRAAARVALAAGAIAVLVAGCKPLAGKPIPPLPTLPTMTTTIAPAPTSAPTTTMTTATTSAPPSTTVSSAEPAASSSVKPPAVATPRLVSDALAPGVVPQPGQVGYRGDRAKLKVVDGPATAPPGTQWNSGALRFGGGDVTLENVHVKGGIEYSGTGTLTIRNSVIEGNHLSWSPLLGNSGHIDVRDTTITYTDPQWPGPQWGNGAIHGDATVTVIRCDISGTPDGIQNGPGNSTIEQNHIHDMLRAGDYPNNTHNDGIQNYGGPNLSIKHNRIDISADGKAYDGTHQNAAVFIMPSDGYASTNLQIVGNYLSGGGYILRLGAPMSGAVITDNRFGLTTGGWGEVLLDAGGIARWVDNLSATGNQLSPPG
ncbi:right-handed parallel beta-helix repeat-containing protein [Actinokineospora iranica]|uniref:Right handed beta helix region n=1 Tax=Actinokineospora iranica TaxID=1271860 RepID=A0A1G6QJX0_9PSEU|nr:right-handed parallel beta-helix repeat-containing protein [Actinokineospora iranica]SDC92491.1 Right handed beta helix region [Actinokineospora iranica]